jgi:hypothetical protein
MFTLAQTVDISPPTDPDEQDTPELQNEDQGRLLGIERLVLSAKIQPRVALDEPTIETYRELMAHGTVFDPVIAYWDGRHYWVADGFHRVEAAKRCGFKEIAVEVREGIHAEAEFFACGANTRHGKPLTNEDKHKIVGRLVCKRHRERATPDGKPLSDRAISRLVGVSPTFVGMVQKKLFPEHETTVDTAHHGTRDTGKEAAETRLEVGGAMASVHGGHLEGEKGGAWASEREVPPEPTWGRADATRRNRYPLGAPTAAVTEDVPPPPTAGPPIFEGLRSQDMQASDLMEALVAHVMGFVEAQHEAEPSALVAVFRQAVPVVEEAKTLHTHRSGNSRQGIQGYDGQQWRSRDGIRQ